MKKETFFLLCGILLTGCSNNLDAPQPHQTDEGANYTIPVSQALENLSDALEGINFDREKHGLPLRTLQDIECIAVGKYQRTNKNPLMKGSGSIELVDTTLYIVNFANEQGYAVLSGDSRMPDDVLAITDKGYLSAAELMREDDYSNLEIDTLNPYCAEDDDYYVGSTNKDLTTRLIMDYRNKYIPGQETPRPTTYYEYGPWKRHSSVPPLVRVKWHQDDPFNKYSPKRCIPKELAPAGCVAIAVAQILSANQNVTTLNGVTIDWSSMNRSTQPEGDDRTKIANWVRYIGKKCHMIYGCHNGEGYGLATPERAKKFLKDLSPYKNVKKLKTWDRQAAINMVKAGKPVFISAFRELFSAHAWVIDGYLKQQRTRTEKRIGSNTIVSTTTEYRELLHCNYGWKGTANGYYTPGLFNVTAGPVEIDPIDGSKSISKKGQYDYWYRMITYDF